MNGIELLTKGFYYYSICLGMTSYRFEFEKNKIQSTRGTRLLALAANGLTLLLLPLVIWDSSHLMDGIELRSLMTAANLVKSGVLVVVIIYTVVFRYKREKASVSLGKKLIKLSISYLNQLPKDKGSVRSFQRLLLLKHILLAYLIISTFAVLATNLRKWDWYSYVLIFFYCHIFNMMWMAVYYYNYGLWMITSSYCYLNSHLEMLLKQFEALSEYRRLNKNSSTLTEMTVLLCRDFERLMRAHSKLSHVGRQLNQVYDLQMLGVRFNSFVSHVIYGYYAVVMIWEGILDWRMLAFSWLTYFIMILEMYLNDLLCDMTVRGYHETIYTLKIFNCHDLWNSRLRNAVEYFALSLSSNKLRLVCYGLFEVGKVRFFVLMTTTVSYIIMLVQFHIILGKKGI